MTLLALGSVACGDSSPLHSDDPIEVAEASQPIMGGYLDTEDTHAVGLVHLSGYGVGACSGTLISPNVILTAQHCVANSSGGGAVSCGTTVFYPPYAASELYVTTRTSFTQNVADYHFASEVHVAPGGNQFCGNDIALIILGKPISSAEATPATPRVDVELAQFEEYYAIGFGAQFDAQNAPSGTRYRRDGLFTQCVGGLCGIGSGITNTEWLGDTGVCQGDSGGGAFDLADRVHGVASRGSQGCTFPVYSGVFGHGQWIKDMTVYAAGLVGIEPPPWATGFPTDPVFNHPVGDACSDVDECPSRACLDGYCTRSCNEAAPCPDGYQCREDAFCEKVPEAPDVAPEGSGYEIGGGCHIGGARRVAAPWALVLVALAGVALARRRPSE